MAIIYTQRGINFRLQGVINAIDNGPANGFMRLYSAGNVILANMQLVKPSGTVAGGVLTFNVPASDANSPGGGNAVTADVTDSLLNVIITGLTVGIPLSGMNVIISNGLNSTLIQPTQVVTLISGQIIGS